MVTILVLVLVFVIVMSVVIGVLYNKKKKESRRKYLQVCCVNCSNFFHRFCVLTKLNSPKLAHTFVRNKYTIFSPPSWYRVPAYIRSTSLCWGLTCDWLVSHPGGVNDSCLLHTVETWDKHHATNLNVLKGTEKDLTKLT